MKLNATSLNRASLNGNSNFLVEILNNFVLKNFVAYWNVRAFANKPFSPSWDMQARIPAKTQTFLYHVFNPVSAPFVAAWGVRAFSGTTLALAWSNRVFVMQTNVLSWNLYQFATGTLTTVWDSIGRVTQTWRFRWHVPFGLRQSSAVVPATTHSNLTPHTFSSTVTED